VVSVAMLSAAIDLACILLEISPTSCCYMM
jgi:hypothetical protein